jgi:hypothetical protein
MPRYPRGATPTSAGDQEQFKRVTINLTVDLYERLYKAAAAKGMTITELLRRSLALQLYLIEHAIEEVQVVPDAESPPEKLVML